MDLLKINEETKLPEPTAEALTIKVFSNLWKRSRPIDGDRDGKKKTFNLKEIGYIYFNGKFDSRFKLMSEIDKEKKIKEILDLSPDYKPDQLVLDCIKVFEDSQVTASSSLVSSLEGITNDFSHYLTSKRAALKSGQLVMKDASELLNMIDKFPDTLETLAKAKLLLQQEQNALLSGRKGRTLNKFELPDQ